MKNKQEYINFSFIPNHFEYFIEYIFCYFDSGLVTRNSLKNLKELVYKINENDYEDDIEMISKLAFIKCLLKATVDKGIRDSDAVLMSCQNNKYSDYFQEIIDDLDDKYGNSFDDADIMFTDEFISSVLKYSFIFDNINKIDDFSIQLKTNDYDSLPELCQSFEEILSDLNSKFRKVKETNEESMNDFNSNDDSLETAIDRSIKQLNADTSVLQTCIKAKNQMLDGGFEAGRFYLILGLQG